MHSFEYSLQQPQNNIVLLLPADIQLESSEMELNVAIHAHTYNINVAQTVTYI